jgi:hypothetical protein
MELIGNHLRPALDRGTAVTSRRGARSAEPPAETVSVATPPGVRGMNFDALLSGTRQQTSEPVTVEMVIESEAAPSPFEAPSLRKAI